jgi:hypothetical protein
MATNKHFSHSRADKMGRARRWNESVLRRELRHCQARLLEYRAVATAERDDVQGIGNQTQAEWYEEWVEVIEAVLVMPVLMEIFEVSKP